MNKQEAKEILLAYRPGTEDEKDPEVAEALAMARKDDEMARWLAGVLAAQTALRTRLQQIEPPAGLKDRLLAEPPNIIRVRSWRMTVAWAAAAAVVFLLGLYWLLFQSPVIQRDFDEFRDRMVRTVIREYRMDITTNDPQAIRNYLREEQLDVDPQPAEGLRNIPLFGAGRLSWKGHPVAMICFQPEPDRLLYLFVVDDEAVEEEPGERAVTKQVSHLGTVSWSGAGKTYVLAGEMEPEQIRNYL